MLAVIPVYGIRWAFRRGAGRAVYARGRYDFEVDLEIERHRLAGGRADGEHSTAASTQPLRQWMEIHRHDGVIRVQDMWVPDAAAGVHDRARGDGPRT